MNCDRVQLLLNGYIDGELDLVSALDIEDHLQSCAACSREYRLLMTLHTVTSNKSLYHLAPAHLEKQIHSSLIKTNPTSLTWFTFSWGWLVPVALLGAFLFFILGFLGRDLFTQNQQTSIAQQVQMAHVRSLMANHLMDVASSDQHTVKPWFNGKLDFSPPVTDLAEQGFPLVGGRLDFLDGKPVAALVYQRNKHYINLFIWPTADLQESLQTSTYNGYHLFHWNQSGMTFWAVSDLNADELDSFIRFFQNSTNSRTPPAADGNGWGGRSAVTTR
jgi:anti-sigma factor RsiW